MNLKKSLFGGYKRDYVDAVIRQMTENEEQAQAKIALLNNEFHLSKESAQKNFESIQTELVIKQKSLQDMSRTIEEKNSRIIELETKQNTIFADFEEQYRVIISRQDEMYKTKIAKLEEEYTAKITDLEGKYQQNAKFIQQKDDQVKKIGQLYVDAQEYTEKMKMEAKTKTFEAIDRIFVELSKTQEQFDASFAQISQKKNNLKQLTGELLDTLHVLQNKADEIDYDQVSFDSAFNNIQNAKDQIKNQIHDEFEKDNKVEKEQPLPKAETVIKEPLYEEIPATPVFEQKAEKAEPQIDYAAQIEELRQKIERQEELFRLSDRFANTANETTIKNEPVSIAEPVSITEPIVTEARLENKESSLMEPRDYMKQDDFKISEETRNQSEKDLLEKENYSKYFAEIEKKYYKEKQPVSYEPELNARSSAATLPAGSSDISAAAELVGMELFRNKKDETEDPDNNMPKKPSIKDILNKYANMK